MDAALSRPAHGLVQLHSETIVPATLDETFTFFSTAANLERLTPPWLNFHIKTPSPIVMREGLEIEYQIVLYGVPIPWVSRIDVWEPGVRFVDRQIRGPYRWWHHEHRFAAVDDGTRVIDHVEFLPRLAWLTSGKVRRDVERIFTYRERALGSYFGGQLPSARRSAINWPT
jgi:ligand-binding SRPBCC domain-containing protein